MTVKGCNFPPPASAESRTSLRQLLPPGTPSDYFTFLERSDGGQIWFDAEATAAFDCIRIYSVSRMLELRASLQALFPSLIVIGGDQGSQHLGYDTSATVPWPILMHLPGYGTTQVAASFAELERRYFKKVGVSVEV